jgi:hypothetical protein
MLRISEYSGSTPITRNVPLLKGLTALAELWSSATTVAHQEAVGADLAHVAVIQAHQPARAPPPRLHLGAAVEHDDDVLADVAKAVALSALEAIAHGHNQHHGRHAPRNSRHGQNTAQLVAQQTGKDVRE